jgi:hypothetical protein
VRPYISWPSGFNIAPAKITGYLLNLSGGSPAKARWWLSQGFDPDRPEVLIEALFEHTSATNFVGLRLPPKMWGHRLVLRGRSARPWPRTQRSDRSGKSAPEHRAASAASRSS